MQQKADELQARADAALAKPQALMVPAEVRQLVRDLVSLVAELARRAG